MNSTHADESVKARPSTIEPDVLFRALSSGERILVLDVRDTADIERSRRHFPNALEIPVHQLFVRRSDLPHDKSATIVAVSENGAHSRQAVFTLSLLGYTRARALAGGIDAWASRGLPLARWW